ncbi:hypothetical protein G4B88_003948 [Cannabis sativa]|uniref:Large ribosomal subunit protein mL53 n=1 Tax=Cannabis sativa TaxID=3483 RepID=A0A7J6GXU8_CANSA|nr:hypothetical protein G4B88_003948 [Cannabis sativa]
MLKFLSKVRIEFNALDPRTASCLEFLAQCNARKAKESNPACQLLVKRRTDDEPPKIAVTFVNGVEEVFDATSTPAQNIRNMILEKGQHLETEQMFREAGESWPVIIPEEEINQYFPGTKMLNQGKQKKRSNNCSFEMMRFEKRQVWSGMVLVNEIRLYYVSFLYCCLTSMPKRPCSIFKL